MVGLCYKNDEQGKPGGGTFYAFDQQKQPTYPTLIFVVHHRHPLTLIFLYLLPPLPNTTPISLTCTSAHLPNTVEISTTNMVDVLAVARMWITVSVQLHPF